MLAASAVEALGTLAGNNRDKIRAKARAPRGEALVFTKIPGLPLSPDNLNRDCRKAITAQKLPDVMFYGLRHSHSSALIASGLDLLIMSRRRGHGTLLVTLNSYSSRSKDRQRGPAIEGALRTGIGQEKRRSTGSGANRVPNDGFSRPAWSAKCLIGLCGDVAERLKAAVC
ncbi:MAG: tyrosine-type recombinase/integrase [Hyphomicrobiales bacterium]